MKLYTKITIGLVAGIILGWVLNIWYDISSFKAADKDGNGFLTVSEVIASDLDVYKDKGATRKASPKDSKPDFRQILNLDHHNRKDYIEVGFEIADVDKSGTLSRYEVISKGGEYNKSYGAVDAFANADTSGDGQLSLAEIKLAEYPNLPASREIRFNVADVNRDGSLSRNEVLANGKSLPQFVARESFYAADMDLDSLLSLEEYVFSFIAHKDYLDKKWYKADQNNDNILTVSEDKKVRGMAQITAYTDWIGMVFIRLVKMVVVPLILASLILGAANLGDIRKLGSLGIKAFGFFMLTTAVAVSLGVLAANFFRPGDGLPEEKKKELLQTYRSTADSNVNKASEIADQPQFERIKNLFVNMVPTNPVKSLADGDMLAIIFFALFVGVCLTMIPPERSITFIKTIDGLNEVVLKMVMLAMETAPYGVFALILSTVADMGIDILIPLGKYGLVVIGALLAHVLITHFSFVVLYLRLNPLQFLKAIKEALLLGFSTSSSSATLPISMDVTQANLGVSKEVSSFVLPLGATVNMDGTALYQGVAAIFIAQVYGIELAFTDQIIMVLTATLASIGAAGVPGAGMITLAVVLGTAGIPLEGIALIFGMDRILDMFRTTINIVGDITCASVMAKSEGEKVTIYEDRDMIPG